MKFTLSKTAISIKRRFLLFMFIFISVSAHSNTLLQSDSLQCEPSQKAKKTNIFNRTIKYLGKMLEQDPFYVRPHRFNMTLMPQYTYGYEYYRFSAKDKDQSISIVPSSNNKIGLYIGWKCFSVGYSVTLNKIQPEFDMEMSFFASRGGIELFYRKRSDGFRISNLKGFTENDMPLTNYNKEFDGLTVSQLGANLLYVFNYKKFSFPAAYSQKTSQRISAGSFILGLSYNKQRFMFDHTAIDPKIESLMLPELKFQNINYIDLSINFGYSYNLVFAKNFLANISVSPAIGYKNTSLKSIYNSKEFISNINFDLISRLALVYNNGKYYAGASIVSHRYSYIEPTISIENSFGYIKVYAGFNFWRNK